MFIIFLRLLIISLDEFFAPTLPSPSFPWEPSLLADAVEEDPTEVDTAEVEKKTFQFRFALSDKSSMSALVKLFYRIFDLFLLWKPTQPNYLTSGSGGFFLSL